MIEMDTLADIAFFATTATENIRSEYLRAMLQIFGFDGGPG